MGYCPVSPTRQNARKDLWITSPAIFIERLVQHGVLHWHRHRQKQVSSLFSGRRRKCPGWELLQHPEQRLRFCPSGTDALSLPSLPSYAGIDASVHESGGLQANQTHISSSPPLSTRCGDDAPRSRDGVLPGESGVPLSVLRKRAGLGPAYAGASHAGSGNRLGSKVVEVFLLCFLKAIKSTADIHIKIG